MKPLIKPGEIIPHTIQIVRTDKKFIGDCRIDFLCKVCGQGNALTHLEYLCQEIMCCRNDENNPFYHWGARYGLKYKEICNRDGRIYPEWQIRNKIIMELKIEDHEMQT